MRTILTIDENDNAEEVGLAGLVEKQLSRYITADLSLESTSKLYERVISEVERPLLRLVLRATQGNRVKAASVLGINRTTLLRLLRQHGLDQRPLSKREQRRSLLKQALIGPALQDEEVGDD